MLLPVDKRPLTSSHVQNPVFCDAKIREFSKGDTITKKDSETKTWGSLVWQMISFFPNLFLAFFAKLINCVTCGKCCKTEPSDEEIKKAVEKTLQAKPESFRKEFENLLKEFPDLKEEIINGKIKPKIEKAQKDKKSDEEIKNLKESLKKTWNENVEKNDRLSKVALNDYKKMLEKTLEEKEAKKTT